GIVLAGVLGKDVEFSALCSWAAANGYGSVDVPRGRTDAVELVRKAGLEPGATGGLPPLIVADDKERKKNVDAAIERLEEIARAGVPLVQTGHAPAAG